MDVKLDVLNWIEETIGEKLDERKLHEDTKLVQEGILGSLNIIHLAHWIEKHYGFDISEDDFAMSNFETIAAIVGLIERYSRLQATTA